MKAVLGHERPRFFLWIPVLMGLGIVCYQHLPGLNFLGYVGFTCLALAFLFRQFLSLTLILLSLSFFCWGYGALSYKTATLERNNVRLIQKKEKGTFTGMILDQEYLLKKNRYVVGLSDGRRVRLTSNASLEIGAIVKFDATLLPFSKPILPDGFDYGRAAFYKGLSATWRMTHPEILEHPKVSSFEKIRSFVTAKLLEMMPNESGAIAAALVTGERGRIPEATRQAYADAGIAHVLAISGLHLSMIAGLVFMVFRRGGALSLRLAERYDLKKFAAVATFPFLLGYLLISGMGVPAIRSFIMVGIILLGVLVHRQAISMRTVAMAAILILTIQPENLTTASFSLSFAAVIALIAAYERGWSPPQDWGQQGSQWRKPIVYGVGIIASTVIATLATLPITLYIFNRISLQAIIGNLVAIPLMGFLIMPLLLCAVMLMPFGKFSPICFMLDQSIQLMTKVALWTASLPGAGIQVPKPPQAFIWLSVIGGLWLCLWRTRVRYLGIIPLVMSIGLLWVKPAPFYWKAPEGQIYWYDGTHLSTFAHARHNDFTEEILQRHLGLQDIRYEPEDLVLTEFSGQDVALLNQRFSWRKHRYLCDECDVIVSPYRLPDGVM